MSDAAGRHAPRKRFGQHFLHDPHVVGRIVRAIAPRPGDALVEIGPGLGALTGELLAAAGTMTAIEIDRDLAPRLRQAHGPALRVIEADVLDVDFRTLAPPSGRLRVVGNLPYNISTPLMFHLLGHAGVIADMHFMLQKEVVDRLAARPGTPDYGRLTVAVAARAAAEPLFTVGAGAFRPPPRVESAVVRLTPRPPPVAIPDLETFDAVVRHAFGQRRKTLGNALRGLRTPERIRAAGVDPGVRAETLSLEQFAALARA